ncbi:MAG TPA: type IV secretion system DNA-binding domain-containing protein [Candidatus Magasanikbacteria bacterium]|nr:type IV secretion system DNA-binding domain-containing protein [Candidatus Magasanikbacteria bacterium]
MSDNFWDNPEEEKKEPEYYASPDVNYFAATNFRNQMRKFGVKTDDRRRHVYVVGKTGMGKTTLMENMVLNDIYAGHGVGVVDPHGDFAEKIINYIPPRRINDVVYFNPADIDFPVGFNIFETVRAEHKHLVASGLMGVFKKIWVDMWSSRMEYILNNTILALLEYPGTTLLGINRMLADDEYRNRIVANLKDPVVKAFWQSEFAGYNDRYKQEAVAPIQNKIGQFLSASVIRNIVAQVKSKIDIRDIMDSKKIFIMNLSKGRIGEDNSRLLGGMLITKIQLSAMERVDMKESDRKDFFLYVDEFQNFATESFSNILSEARKYRLDLTMAHQYMDQLDEHVRAAVIGNVGSIITYRVGSTDAEILCKEFSPVFTEEDLINLPKYNVYLKLMIDGVASRPFSAITLPPIGSPTGSAEKVVKVSRERYATPRDQIEDKIMRWSGMDVNAGSGELDEDEIEFNKAAPLVNIPAPSAPKKDFVRDNGRRDDKKMKKNKNSIDFASLRPEPVFIPPPTVKIPHKENKNFISSPSKLPMKNPEPKIPTALSLSSLQSRTEIKPPEKLAAHVPPEPIEKEVEEIPKSINFSDLKRTPKPPQPQNNQPNKPQHARNDIPPSKQNSNPKPLKPNDIVSFD